MPLLRTSGPSTPQEQRKREAAKRKEASPIPEDVPRALERFYKK